MIKFKQIVKEEDFKNMIYQRKDGTQDNFKSWFNIELLAVFYISFALGALAFFGLTFISTPNALSIANQMCNNVGGYMVSYKYNFFGSNFASIICKVNYQLIELIH